MRQDRLQLLAWARSTPKQRPISAPRERPHYQHHVAEYWIVDLDSRLLERWRPGDERPEIIVERLDWRPTDAVEPFLLELRTFFTEVSGESSV